MTYPLSSEVSVGDPTEASQYNNLRRDALYLGSGAGESGTLLQLLAQGMGTVRLTRVSASTIGLTASPADPCAVMIGGRICAVTSSLTALLSLASLPTAGRYGIWAVAQTDGTFTLAAGASGPDGSRQIGTLLWDGTGVIPGTVRNMAEYTAAAAANTPQTANGRLTFLCGTPVPDGDITGASTLYFTPYGGNKIGLLTGSEWEVYSFTELQLSLSGLSNELPYDIFIEATYNGLTLSASPWGSSSGRLAQLTYVNGVPVLSGDPAKRFLGTIAKNEGGFGEDSLTGRLLWNQNNRLPRGLLSTVQEQSAGTYTSLNYWAPYWSAAKAPAVRVLIGTADAELDLEGTGLGTLVTEEEAGHSSFYMVGIGRDPAMEAPYTENSSCVPVFMHTFGNSPVTARVRNHSSAFLGYHKYVLMFYANNQKKPAAVFYGTNAAAGLYGVVYA